MAKMARVTSCDHCPHFDNVYYSYEEECDFIGKVPWEKRNDGIPEECPLKDWEEQDEN